MKWYLKMTIREYDFPTGGKFYRDLFFALNGVGPYICFFCSGLIWAGFDKPEGAKRDELVVHHNQQELESSHRRCHQSHHAKDTQFYKGKKKVRQLGLFAQTFRNESNRGRKRTIEQRRRIAEGVRKSWAAGGSRR